ncbi:MAG: glutathione S-transferase family protein [Cyanobacteria bacterium K_DeepCast_35m_m2_023]|nr:glutathione S-transferase family protein [Cyanobacteria bacterium K_DeepCast_35m_m2_023]
MQLHQFRQSPFCDKVRMVLAAKGLSYDVVEVTPGFGQISLFRLSGQRQVPVLVDGETVVADSTAIALHLEQHYPQPSLQPTQPELRARAMLLEDWADTALASAVRSALLQAAAAEPELRAALLPAATPAPLKQLVAAVPAGLGQWADTLGETLLGLGERQQLQRSLEHLQQLVNTQPFLVGTSLSLADLAVVAQLSLLRFPPGWGEPLAGRAVPGLGDSPLLDGLFNWRDRVLESLG